MSFSKATALCFFCQDEHTRDINQPPDTHTFSFPPCLSLSLPSSLPHPASFGFVLATTAAASPLWASCLPPSPSSQFPSLTLNFVNVMLSFPQLCPTHLVSPVLIASDVFPPFSLSFLSGSHDKHRIFGVYFNIRSVNLTIVL